MNALTENVRVARWLGALLLIAACDDGPIRSTDAVPDDRDAVVGNPTAGTLDLPDTTAQDPSLGTADIPDTADQAPFEVPLETLEVIPGGHIAFAYRRPDGFYQVQLLDLLDMSTRALTAPELFVSAPVWRPDGQAIAYVSWHSLEPSSSEIARSILTVDLRTGQSRTLLEPQRSLGGLAWSPDGGRMAFIQDGEIHVGPISNLGEAARITTDGTDSPYGSVDWSPDGEQLLVERADRAYTMFPDGTGREQLISAFDLRLLEWHPNGTSILYWTAGHIRIHFSEWASQLSIDADLIDDPSWSPGGKWVVHVRTYSEDEANRNGIYVISADGNRSQQLTSSGGGESNPRWH